MKLLSAFKFIVDIISWISIGVMISMGIFTLVSNGNVFRGYRSFLVLSGSMEPTINIGSIIIVHNQSQYQPPDVVTFTTEGRIVTHRLIGVKNQTGEATFSTKGDANQDSDAEQVDQADIIGKVIFVIPLIGRFVAFAQSLPGLIVLILIPGLGLALDQIIRFSDAQRQK